MMLVRGVVEVTGAPLAMPDAAISGIAGINHILISVGLVLLTVMFKRVVNRRRPPRLKPPPATAAKPSDAGAPAF